MINCRKGFRLENRVTFLIVKVAFKIFRLSELCVIENSKVTPQTFTHLDCPIKLQCIKVFSSEFELENRT